MIKCSEYKKHYERVRQRNVLLINYKGNVHMIMRIIEKNLISDVYSLQKTLARKRKIRSHSRRGLLVHLFWKISSNKHNVF